MVGWILIEKKNTDGELGRTSTLNRTKGSAGNINKTLITYRTTFYWTVNN